MRPVHDVHEHTAHRAAAQALSGPGLADAAFWPVGDGPRLLGGALGSAGQALPAPTRSYFERRLGRDFGGVRVHTGALAGATARAMHASAYTLGSDIAFASGRYAPESEAGRRLLGHELAHVAQQAGGSPAAGLGAAPLGVQRAVETLGGNWDTGTYRLVYGADGSHHGCEIDRLVFTPNEQVDATKIGLTQSLVAMDEGAPNPVNATAAARTVPIDQPGGGTYIDRLAERRNPIYGMDDPTGTDQSLGGSAAAGNAQWGYRYSPSFLGFGLGVTIQQDASLYDRPRRPGHGANARQVFETTALAVEGAQAGTFYGSVRWGWESDASNTPTLVPLGVVAVGVPSASFRLASDLWNRNPTSTGADTIDLPIAAGTAGAKMPSEMTTGEIMNRLEQIRTERQQAVIGNVLAPFGLGETRTTESLDFEEAALRRELTSRAGDFPMPTGDTRYA
ncbi:DUF4157 domain-containing protein [Roseomonas sp. AR75]|uniref:eCIS core domain-containing protein n=1 Tax=Roseomonas sp. AR75 TaxID=2562311 RepID=UPI001485AEBC|nr:DUF4157 domain-containing protein [Roseomonas sp. AR75]